MKNSNTIMAIAILGIAGFFWFSNNQRIKALQEQLRLISSQPQPSYSDRPKWYAIIRTLLDLGLDVYGELSKGGLFGNGGGLDNNQIDSLLNDYYNSGSLV